MKTWNEYKKYISSLSDELRADVEELCALASFATLVLAITDFEKTQPIN